MVRQVRAARTREALIRAAAAAFAEDGYALASLPVISRAAGVSTGALHFHFPSKDSLAREVEEAAVRCVQRLVQPDPGEGGPLLRHLANVARELLTAFAEDPVLRAGFGLGADPSRKGGQGPGPWWSGWVHDLLRRAEEAGELPEGVAAERVATVVVAATVGFMVLTSWRGFRVPAELGEEFRDQSLSGLVAASCGLQELPKAGGCTAGGGT